MSKKTISNISRIRAGIGAALLPLIVSALTACNSDVFVKEFEASPLDMSVDAGGGVLETRFSTGGWRVINALMNGTFADCVTWIGNGKYFYGCPKTMDEMDVVDSIQVKTSAGPVCTMTRNGKRSLRVKMAENVSSIPRNIVIVVSDDIFSRNIHVSQAAGEGWKLDRVEWAALPDSSAVVLEQKGNGLTWDNKGSGDVVVNVKIFDGCTREVHFMEDASGDAGRQEISGDAEIPDGRLTDGALSFSGVKIPYGNMLQSLEIPLPDTVAKVSFKPGKHTCRTVLEYEEYEVRFKAFFRTANGSTMKKEGLFRSKTPTGKWYITKPE